MCFGTRTRWSGQDQRRIQTEAILLQPVQWQAPVQDKETSLCRRSGQVKNSIQEVHAKYFLPYFWTIRRIYLLCFLKISQLKRAIRVQQSEFSYNITFDELKNLFSSMNGKLRLTNVYQHTFLMHADRHFTFYCKKCGEIYTDKNTHWSPSPSKLHV